MKAVHPPSAVRVLSLRSRFMKHTPLLLTLLLLAGTVACAAGPHYYAGGAGYYAQGYYAPPPPPLPVVRYAPPPSPGYGYAWIDGYWRFAGGRYSWRQGYWTRPPHARAEWVAPRYHERRYYDGYWRR